jgi:D-alanyl-D-alanine carboxypeptidase
LAIGLFAGNFPFNIDEQQSVPFSTNDAEPNTYFDTNGATDEQSNGDETAWYLILVNKWNYIPANYEVELMELSNGQSVDKRIYPALQKMINAARDDDVYPVVVSGYRSAEKQQSLMDDKIAEYRALGYSDEKAKTKAEKWVAIPGTSEHQLGIAVDINADGAYSAGNEVYAWLDKNAHKYGFIYRYPSDKTEITGVIDEPWHYRYVGTPAAMEIHNQGICLEEYLNQARR